MNIKKNEKNINEILSRTREMQEEAKNNLEKQQEIILKDAEFKAVEILENSRKESRQIREEVLELQHKKDSFSSRLKYLIHSYLDLLNMLDAENLLDEDEKNIAFKKTERFLPQLLRHNHTECLHIRLILLRVICTAYTAIPYQW